MFLSGRKQGSLQQRVMHTLLLGQILPALLLTPSQADGVLLHSHCDEAHHLHVLNNIELTAWSDVHAGQHHCASGETDTCCETSAPGETPDGVVLQRPPILACRVRSIETAPPQPAVNAVLPGIAAACAPALQDPADALLDRTTPRSCLDALLSSSHALLI